jgi:hypothetical protein
MRIFFLLFAALLFWSCLPALAQEHDPAVPAGKTGPPVRSESRKAESEKSNAAGGEDASRGDPFDFSGTKKSAGGEQEHYLVLDESIKVQVEPIERSAVIDRVAERSTIYVKAPGSVRVEVYLEPVDSPYCGRTLVQPRLLGQSSDVRHNFPIVWATAEPYRYVKVYARAYKADGVTFARSRSVDLSMFGQRFSPRAGEDR